MITYARAKKLLYDICGTYIDESQGVQLILDAFNECMVVHNYEQYQLGEV